MQRAWLPMRNLLLLLLIEAGYCIDAGSRIQPGASIRGFTVSNHTANKLWHGFLNCPYHSFAYLLIMNSKRPNVRALWWAWSYIYIGHLLHILSAKFIIYYIVFVLYFHSHTTAAVMSVFTFFVYLCYSDNVNTDSAPTKYQHSQ